MSIVIYQDNLSPVISDQLTNADGSVVDLTGAALQFKMRREDSPALVANSAANITDAVNGKWSYTWQANDTHYPGVFKAWLSVTQGGVTQDTPEFTVNIVAHSPQALGGGYARSMARQKIRLFADTAVCPEISDPVEIEFLLDMGRVMDLYGAPPPKGFTWYPGILLSVGTFVVPSVPNGHYYAVTASDADGPGYVEPVWPTTSGGTVTTDGVTYTEQGGRDWTETYDANYCIAQAWLMKAGRVASYYNFMVAGKMFSRQQFYDHCMKQYRMYAGKARLKAMRLATPLIGQSLSNVPLWNDVPSNWDA